MLRAILSFKNISLYHLEKTSQISHATLNDIYNERSNIDNCSISTISNIARSLNMEIDDLYKKLIYNDLSLFAYSDQFDLFKSNTLQRMKRMGEDAFVNHLIESDAIGVYHRTNNDIVALYLLSLLDYLLSKSNKPTLEKYNDLRKKKLDKIYISKSIYLLLKTKHITITSIYKECIKEFLNHNIIEANVYDVI